MESLGAFIFKATLFLERILAPMDNGVSHGPVIGQKRRHCPPGLALTLGIVIYEANKTGTLGVL